jgi:hypothetical protein
MASQLIGFTTALKTARATVVADAMAGGKIRVYNGTRPVTNGGEMVNGQELLVEFSLPTPAGTVTNGVFTGAAISPATIVKSGTPTWARVLNSSTVALFDADVGPGGVVTLNTASLVKDGSCAVTSVVLTEN